MPKVSAISNVQLPVEKPAVNEGTSKQIAILAIAIIGALAAFVFLPISQALSLCAATFAFYLFFKEQSEIKASTQEQSRTSKKIALTAVPLGSTWVNQKQFYARLDEIIIKHSRTLSPTEFRKRGSSEKGFSPNVNSFLITPKTMDEQTIIQQAIEKSPCIIEGEFVASIKGNSPGSKAFCIEISLSVEGESITVDSIKENLWEGYKNSVEPKQQSKLNKRSVWKYDEQQQIHTFKRD